MRQAHNDTQSTMTDLANQFGSLHVNQVHEILQMISQAINGNKPVERLNLAPEEQQQVKMIASQVDRDKKLYNSQIHSIASLKTLDVQTGTNLQHLLTPALQQAQESAAELQRNKEQMRKVKTLASV